MHRLRRLHDSQYIMKNPFTNENSNLSNIFHNNIHRKKVESLKVRSTEEFLCQFAWLPCRFFRGRRQGRQPLNNNYTLYIYIYIIVCVCVCITMYICTVYILPIYSSQPFAPIHPSFHLAGHQRLLLRPVDAVDHLKDLIGSRLRPLRKRAP